jgi:NTP pyrophosphatase (non-canonical NTP hydrolase)
MSNILVRFSKHVAGFAQTDRYAPRECQLNFALGVGGEAGEVLECIKKHNFHGKVLDIEHLTEEIGGLLWYIEALCQNTGITLEQAMEFNIKQLQARHGGTAFNRERADFGKKGGGTPPATPAVASVTVPADGLPTAARDCYRYPTKQDDSSVLSAKEQEYLRAAVFSPTQKYPVN